MLDFFFSGTSLLETHNKSHSNKKQSMASNPASQPHSSILPNIFLVLEGLCLPYTCTELQHTSIQKYVSSQKAELPSTIFLPFYTKDRKTESLRAGWEGSGENMQQEVLIFKPISIIFFGVQPQILCQGSILCWNMHKQSGN